MSVDQALDKLKEKGFRITPQRVQVVKLLHELSHPTADEIYSVMAKEFPYVSHATVYNTLKLLKELGIAAELPYSNRVSHYEPAQSQHCHFNCKVCGGIYDLDEMETDKVLPIPKLGGAFQVDSCRVELYGICPICMKKLQ